MSSCGRNPQILRFVMRGLWRFGISIFAWGMIWTAARGQTTPPPASKQQAPPPTSPQKVAAPSQAVKLEDIEQRLGPFQLGPPQMPQSYTIVLHGKRLPGGRGNDPSSQALTSLEIRDATGTAQHQEKFEYTMENGILVESCWASAEVLKGSMIAELLISTGCVPSTPEGGGTWEIFSVWNGKFMRLGKPFTTEGDLVGLSAGPVTPIGKATLFQPDVIKLRVWTGNFHVIVPLTLNWMQGQLMPPRCLEQSGQGMREGGCELQVEAERVPIGQELSFVRMFSEPNEGFGIPQHVVVKKDSKVEFLAVKVRVVLGEGDNVIGIGTGEDPWLKVRIDGQEGWIHTQEDFLAIGVPQAG